MNEKMEEKNKVGRPLKFPSPKEMQEKIDDYFQDCNDSEIPYTITGLALALDCDRETLLNYAKKEEFFGTIKRAKLMVENALELMLSQGGRPAGIIFNLKNNFNWKDDLTVKHGGTDGSPKKITIEFVDSDESTDSK